MKTYLDKLNTLGWCVIPDAFNPCLIAEVIDQLSVSIKTRDDIRLKNGVIENNRGTLHHLISDHNCYLEIIKNFEKYDWLIKSFLNANYIINSYGGVINTKDDRSYVHNPHKDIRFTSDYKFMVNILVMLDDFTMDNGATYLLSGSQKIAEQPNVDIFKKQADRAIGLAGSILFFDSRLWHSTGANLTDLHRRALTITLTHPFFKQQFNYPEIIGTNNPAFNDKFLKQIIGFNSRTPKSLEEFYVTVDKRMYIPGQDDYING
jgi:hypothetical protein